PAGEAMERDDHLRLLNIHRTRLSIHFRRNELPQILSYVEQVITEAQELGDQYFSDTAKINWGLALVCQGHFTKALPILTQAMEAWKDSPELWQYGAS